MDENKQKEALQSQIESAMQQGASLNAIIDHLSSSEDPFHQEYAKRLGGQQVQDESYRMRPLPKEEITTPLVNTASGAATSFSNLPVEQQIGYGLAGVAGLGGLGLATYAGKEYLRNKISNANQNPQFERQNDIAARNVALEEKKLEMASTANGIEQARIDVEKAKAERIREATRREQELHQQKILQMGKTQAKQSLNTPETDPMLRPDIQQSTGLTGLTEFEKNKGSFQNEGQALKMALQSENNAASKAGQNPIYDALLSEQAKQKLAEAKAAGVTPMTSESEAQTLITTKENASTPPEKLNEQAKAPLPEQIVENKTGIVPKSIADIQQQEKLNPLLKLNPLFQKHLIEQQELLKNNTKYADALQKAYLNGKISPDQFFVPGYGNMDNNIFNTLGPEGRRQALEYKGKTAFGQVQGADYNDIVSKNINDYAERLKQDIPVDLTTRNTRIAEGLAHTKNYSRLGTPMKIGGIAGMAILATDLANAKNGQEKRAALRNLGEAILPPSMTASELAPAVLPANAYSESRKLGSPFYKMFKEGAAPPSMR